MTFLPIVARELRVTARRRSTHLNRLAVAAVGLALGTALLGLNVASRPAQVGMVLFCAFAVITFLYSGLAGVLTTADCLSQEKREGTLGLLFLTDLRGYDIVLGKLAATSLNTFYAMLAMFPVMAIPLLAGGVTGGEFWRVTLVSVNNLLLSLALGMLASAVSRDERKAVVLGLGLMLALAVVLPLLALLCEEWDGLRRYRPLAEWLVLPSPAFGCFTAFDGIFRGQAPGRFYISVAAVHLLAWIALIAACWIVPRTWQEEGASPAARRRRAFRLRLARGPNEHRAALRSRLLAANPFYWLAVRNRLKLGLVWVPFGILGIIWLVGLHYDPRGWKDGAAYVFTGLILHSILKLWLVFEACHRFGADRRSGALELLLATPLRVTEMLGGQFRALVRQFGAPLVVVLLLDIFFTGTDTDPDWVLVWVAGTVVLVADMYTLSWVGMWMGLSSRGVNRAAGSTVVRVLVLPWVIWLAGVLLFVFLIEMRRRTGPSPDWFEYLPTLFWLFLGLSIDLVFGIHAYARLHTRFRQTAAAQYGSRRGAKA